MRAAISRTAGEAVAVSTVMRENPITIPPETPVLDAIALMRREKLACLLVVKDESLVGIVSERDYPQHHRASAGALADRNRSPGPGCAAGRNDFPREIGSYSGQAPGPLIICIGGMHGNEPAGVLAARRVLRALRSSTRRFSGNLVALAGNRAALARGCRYISEDFNRMWLPERLAALDSEARQSTLNTEERECRELLEALGAALTAPSRTNRVS